MVRLNVMHGRPSGGQRTKAHGAKKRESTASQSDNDSSESGPFPSSIVPLREIVEGDVPPLVFSYLKKVVDFEVKKEEVEEEEEGGVVGGGYYFRPRRSTTVPRGASTGWSHCADYDVKKEEVDEEEEAAGAGGGGRSNYFLRSATKPTKRPFYNDSSMDSMDDMESGISKTPVKRARSEAPKNGRPSATTKPRRSLTVGKGEDEEPSTSKSMRGRSVVKRGGRTPVTTPSNQAKRRGRCPAPKSPRTSPVKVKSEDESEQSSSEFSAPPLKSVHGRPGTPMKPRPPPVDIKSEESNYEDEDYTLKSGRVTRRKSTLPAKGVRPIDPESLRSLEMVKDEPVTDNEDEQSGSRSMRTRSSVKKEPATPVSQEKRRGRPPATQSSQLKGRGPPATPVSQEKGGRTSATSSSQVKKRRGRTPATPQRSASPPSLVPFDRAPIPLVLITKEHLLPALRLSRSAKRPTTRRRSRGLSMDSTEVGESSNSDSAAPQRKRGRAPTSMPRAGETTDEDEKCTTPEPSAPPRSLIAATPMKRADARPMDDVRLKGGAESAAAAEKGAESAAAAAASSETVASSQPPAKRRRGRPRKEKPSDPIAPESKEVKDAAAPTAAAAASSETVASSQESQPPAKRGRGRPRKQKPSDAIAPESKEVKDAAAPTAAAAAKAAAGDASESHADRNEWMNEDLAVVSPQKKEGKGGGGAVSPLKEKEKSGDEPAANMQSKPVKVEPKEVQPSVLQPQQRSAPTGLRTPKVEPRDEQTSSVLQPQQRIIRCGERAPKVEPRDEQMPVWDPLAHIPCSSKTTTMTFAPLYETEEDAQTTAATVAIYRRTPSGFGRPYPKQRLIVPKEENAKKEIKKEPQSAGEKKQQGQLQPTVGGAAEAAGEVQQKSGTEGEDGRTAGAQLQQLQKQPQSSAAGVAVAAGTGQKQIPDDQQAQKGQLQPSVGGAAVAAAPGAAPVVRSSIVVANRAENTVQALVKQWGLPVQYPKPTTRIVPQGRKLTRIIGTVVRNVDTSAEKSLPSTRPYSLDSSLLLSRLSSVAGAKTVQPGQADEEIVLSDSGEGEQGVQLEAKEKEKEKEGEGTEKKRDHTAPFRVAEVPVNPPIVYSQERSEWQPFPVAATVNIGFAVRKEQLEMDKLVWSQRIHVGPIPFRAAATVTTDGDDPVPMLGIEVFANEESRAHSWKIKAEFTVKIKDSTGNKLIGTFDEQHTNHRIITGVSLADAVKEHSKYLDESGLIPFKISIDLKSVEGYYRTFFYVLGNPHRHLTDAIIECEGETIYVSSSILSRHSRFFSKAYYGKESAKNKKKLVLDDYCSMDDIFGLLAAMYGLEFPDLTHENVIHILRVGARFGFDQLISHCIDFFDPVNGNMTSGLLMGALTASDELKLIKLQKHCVEFMRENDYFGVVRDSEVYANLSDKYKIHVMEQQVRHLSQKKEKTNDKEKEEEDEEEDEEGEEEEDEDEEEEGEEEEGEGDD